MTAPDLGEGAGDGVRRGTISRWVAGVVVAAGLVGFLTVGANRPSDPHLLAHSSRPQVAGFGEIAYRIMGVGNPRCALLADTGAQQQRGLMNRTDLADHDGMLFRFHADTTTGFYMKDTPMPLSIAWFDAEGRFVSSAEMEPCLERADCPTYQAARPYRFALEVGRGGLSDQGIGAGSHLSVGGTCG